MVLGPNTRVRSLAAFLTHTHPTPSPLTHQITIKNCRHHSTTVNADTASSGGSNEQGVVQHELTITGLKDPHGLKSMVWALKRGGVASAVTPLRDMDRSAGGMGGVGGGNFAALLTKQNELLEEQVGLLKAIAKNTGQ